MFRSLLALALALVATTGAFASSVTDDTRSQTVVVTSTKGNLQAVGAGVIIDAGNGLTVVTAQHIVAYGGTLAVTTADGQTLNVISSRAVPGHDLAVLKTAIPFGIFHPAKPGALPTDGEPLLVWGHPHGNRYTLSSATVQDTNPTIPDGPTAGRFAITCSTCSVGDSGSGVFDAAGRLVGIVTEGYSDDAGRVVMTVAEPIAPVLAIR